ncbi:MAG: class I mannose-6-phosphate isomerase [Caldilineaceae bacterium]|jgi:mannose-6-phosphate isomerase|nr:class I mannose-6-phosphate isomerase [Caldilineaceae bacterium]
MKQTNGASIDQFIYPLTFDPVFKDYPWGGRNLATKLGRTIPDGIVAESWDIAAHAHGSSVVNTGALAGKTLPEVQALLGEALLGDRNTQALAAGKFPLLIKILDANRWLSVQVHPDDAYALSHEDEPGKTEMWVVLHADAGAELIYGFAPGMTRAHYAEVIGTDASVDSLHRVPVKPGDVIFVPSGTVHALGPGIMVAEIQQNSDSTYRIWDWGRPRPLHLEKSLDVLNFSQVQPGPATPIVLLDEEGLRIEQLVRCPYFETERITLPAGHQYYGLCDGSTFEIWAVLQGKTTLDADATSLTLQAVQWALLPAELGEYQISAEEDAVLLRVFTPENER